MIKQDTLMPVGELQELKNGDMLTHNTTEVIANKKIVIIDVPGAFTPTCSVSH